MAKISKTDEEIERMWLNKYGDIFGLPRWRWLEDLDQNCDINYRVLAVANEFNSNSEESELQLPIDCFYHTFAGYDSNKKWTEIKRRGTMSQKAVHRQFCLAQQLLVVFKGDAVALAATNGYKKCPVCHEWFTDHGEGLDICLNCKDIYAEKKEIKNPIAQAAFEQWQKDIR